jgi:hypothetical protein
VLEHGVGRADLGGRLPADGVGAGGVGVVAAGQRAADVDHDDVADLDHPVGHVVVRARAVGTRADDDERRLGVPLLDDRRADVGRGLLLGAARLDELGHPGVHAVDRGARGAQLAHLGRVLAHPQLAQHPPGQARLRVGQRLLHAEDVHRGHRVRHRDPGRPARQVADQQIGVLAVLPGDDLDAEVVEAEVREPGRLHAGHDERGRRAVARGGHDEAGEPLVGGRVGADQVAQVGAGGDEQQLDVEVGGDLARTADAVGVLVGQPGCHARKGIRASSAP